MKRKNTSSSDNCVISNSTEDHLLFSPKKILKYSCPVCLNTDMNPIPRPVYLNVINTHRTARSSFNGYVGTKPSRAYVTIPVSKHVNCSIKKQ